MRCHAVQEKRTGCIYTQLPDKLPAKQHMNRTFFKVLYKPDAKMVADSIKILNLLPDWIASDSFHTTLAGPGAASYCAFNMPLSKPLRHVIFHTIC